MPTQHRACHRGATPLRLEVTSGREKATRVRVRSLRREETISSGLATEALFRRFLFHLCRARRARRRRDAAAKWAYAGRGCRPWRQRCGTSVAMPGKRGLSFVTPRRTSGEESPPPPHPSPYSYSIVRPEVEKLSTWYSFHGEEPVDAFSASPEPIATGEALLTPADVFAPDSVRMRATARLAVRRLTNGRVSACWNSWASMAAERRKAIGQLRMSLKFLVNRKVALAFMSWLAALEASLPNPNPSPNPNPKLYPSPSPEPEPEPEP